MTDDFDELSRFLAYGPLVAPGVVLTTENDGLLAAVEYGGEDHTTLEKQRRLEIATAVGGLTTGLTDGWAVDWEWQRRRDRGYPDQQGGPLAMRHLDGRRGEALNGRQFRSRRFVTLTHSPEMETPRRVAGWFKKRRKGRKPERRTFGHHLPAFREKAQELVDGLGGAVGRARLLDSDGLATMLFDCVSPEASAGVRAPRLPGYPMARVVASRGIVPDAEGKIRMTNGDGRTAHVRVLGVLNFPGQTHPGWCNALEELEVEFRVNVRFIAMGDATAQRVFKKLWRNHDDASYDVRSLIAARFGFMEHQRDAVGEIKAADAAQARIEAEVSGARSGWLTMTVVVWGDTAEEADAREALVAQHLKRRCQIETVREGVNAFPAWLGSLPGHRRPNRRRIPVLHFTMADLISLSHPFSGPTENPHWGCGPVLQLESDGGNPVRVSTHLGELGLMAITGQMRKGKSVTATAIAAGTLVRTRNSRVFWLGADESKSAAMVAAWACGGEVLHLDGKSLALQPLRHLETEDDVGFAVSLVEQLLDSQGIVDKATKRTQEGMVAPMSRAEAQGSIRNAIDRLSRRPPEQRTFSVLAPFMEVEDFRQGLTPFCRGGALGHLVDADADAFSTARFVVIDLMNLLNAGDDEGRKRMVRPVVRALFRRIYREMQDGAPTLTVADEAWRVLAEYPEEIDAMSRRGPKHNGAMVLVGHRPEDFLESGAGSILAGIENLLCFRDPSADEAGSAHHYARYGVTRVQRKLIAGLEVGEMLVCTPQGSRVARLKLDPALRAICSAQDHEREVARRIVARTGPGDRFAAEYLEAVGLYGEAEELRGMIDARYLQAAE